jgi:hypothetical protein
MATEKDFELLDDYLTNRLSGEEKSAFESKLQADPNLQTEKLMQERLIKSIQASRVAELKQMLGNVPVPQVSPGGTSVVAKYAAGTIVAGMVATGLYFYFNRTEDVQQTIENTIASEQGKASTQAVQDNNPASENVTEETADATTAKPGGNTPEAETATEGGTKPELNVYDPTTDEEQASIDVEEAAGERSNAVKSGAPAPKAEVYSNNNEYKFNYQFKNGKLFLYGPFEKNLYEILEFFSGEKRTVFLYYKNNYYLMNDENSEIKTLTPIADQKLISKLRKSRGK